MDHPELPLHEKPGDEIKSSTCYMCACRCGILVHIKNGQIRYIQGNPKHPVNKGVLCAKGNAGIMQHNSPARLQQPLKRVGKRGAGEFVSISWEEALATATKWLGDIRRRNPNELAFFTGRDQSQALTGWWAQQFGTINYAAHGGFCSVNMAAAGLYSIGGSFWEFGEPDWEHSKYLMLWGVAEDHDSNPLKLGLAKLKERGAKIVAINPIRTGYAAIADEWVAVRPGTDGLLIGALIHELLRTDQIDFDYLVRYTNAHWLVIDAPGSADDGMFARDAQNAPLCAARDAHNPDLVNFVSALKADISPRVIGEFVLADGRTARPVFQLLAQRFLGDAYAPTTVATQCGVTVDTIKRLAAEMAQIAFRETVTIAQTWTDHLGRQHQSMTGRPISMHAMRGISAHANGFQTCRMLHVLQMLLGAIDTPGSFRYQPPFPKMIPPANKPGKNNSDPNNPVLTGMPLGFPQGPEDLLVDADGNPQRIDHAFSWAYPLSVHGMLHTVIRNAHAGDPYPIDTLMLFMANMSWNSAMNTRETMRWLEDRDEKTGEYKIPHIIYADAYASEMVSYADLILPDTTYLERHDCISLLDRPISDADGAADGIRQPVVPCERDVRPFQSVLLDLGAALKLPGMVDAHGANKYPNGFAQYMVEHERAPGVGLLAGWRGDGSAHGKGSPNKDQLQRYIDNGCFWYQEIPHAARYYKMANAEYLQWAVQMGFLPNAASATTTPQAQAIVLQMYSETLQKFRNAARGHGLVRPPDHLRSRVDKYFDPLPFWYASNEVAGEADTPVKISSDGIELSALTQRPMFMYHSWGSQNSWLRQIAARNVLYVHQDTAKSCGLKDGDQAIVSNASGEISVQIKYADNVEAGTVWTWNAIGKRKGAWKLTDDAPESNAGFLLNHLINDIHPKTRLANADPITGQAAWFDVKVYLRPATF
jgi:sulfite dehydrogenase (quinone) subunit SoeA